MALDETTLALIKETFEGMKCCKCQKSATRMARRKFFCDDYPVPRPGNPAETMKTHRHPKFSRL